MTDETPTPAEAGTPAPDDGPRDEQIAGLLAVEPLDDLTRRRLVSTAVTATDPGAAGRDEEEDFESDRRGRSRLAMLLPVAAAIAIGVVVGALVVTRPEGTTTTAARQDTDTTVAAGAGSAPAPQAAVNPPALNDSSLLKSLGDLGDVSQPGSLAQAVGTARAKAAATTPTGVCADIPPSDLGLATTSAAGTGTATGVPVDVILGTDATGETIAVVLRSEDCLIIRKDVLPPG